MRYTPVVKSVPEFIRLAMRSDYERLDQKVYSLFSSMGGIYIKFLQVLVSNANALKTLTQQQRMSVFAESTPSPLDHNKLLLDQLGYTRLGEFIHVDDEPFATGSFANVYRARLKSGADVVIKIKRPGLEKQLKWDLFVLRIIAWVIQQLDTQDRYSAGKISKEYSAGMKREVNYIAEVKNTIMLRSSYANNPSVIVPLAYPELSTNDIIVQEYVDGLLLSDVLKQPKHQAEQFVQNKIGSSLSAQMVALAGSFLDRSFGSLPLHGDPHPGNVILMPNNKIGLIDFGLIAGPAKDAQGYLEYMQEQNYINHGSIRAGKFGVTLIRTHSAGLYRALCVVDKALPKIQILKGLEKMMDDRFTANAADIDDVVAKMQGGKTNQIYDSVVNPGNKLSLGFDMDGMLMLRSNNIIWTTIAQLGLYRKLAPGIVDAAVAKASLANLQHSAGSSQDIDSAFEFVAIWLYDVRVSDPVFFKSLKALFPERVLS